MNLINNVQSPSQPVTSGLVYYIDAGNVSSYSGTGSSINNIAGTAPGASATNGSPAFTSAGQSSYFTFNGSTQYILTANLIGQSLSSNITIECWVNTSTDNGVVVTEQGELPVNTGWHDSQIEIVSGNLEVATWEYTVGAGGTVVGPVTRNVWQQYALTQYQPMVYQDASRGLLDVACLHPSRRDLHHRAPRKVRAMLQQKQSG